MMNLNPGRVLVSCTQAAAVKASPVAMVSSEALGSIRTYWPSLSDRPPATLPVVQPGAANPSSPPSLPVPLASAATRPAASSSLRKTIGPPAPAPPDVGGLGAPLISTPPLVAEP